MELHQDIIQKFIILMQWIVGGNHIKIFYGKNADDFYLSEWTGEIILILKLTRLIVIVVSDGIDQSSVYYNIDLANETPVVPGNNPPVKNLLTGDLVVAIDEVNGQLGNSYSRLFVYNFDAIIGI